MLTKPQRQHLEALATIDYAFPPTTQRKLQRLAIAKAAKKAGYSARSYKALPKILRSLATTK